LLGSVGYCLFHKIRLSEISAKYLFFKSLLISARFQPDFVHCAKIWLSQKFFSASWICKKKSGWRVELE